MINQFLPGYTLFITSYLGDADYYDTKVLTGFTLEEAKLVEKFCRACVSGYNQPNESIYSRDSNSFDLDRVANHFSRDEINALVALVFTEFRLPEGGWNLHLGEALQDILVEILGYSDPFTGHHRNFDSLKALYFTEPVQLRSTFL